MKWLRCMMLAGIVVVWGGRAELRAELGTQTFAAWREVAAVFEKYAPKNPQQIEVDLDDVEQRLIVVMTTRRGNAITIVRWRMPMKSLSDQVEVVEPGRDKIRLKIRNGQQLVEGTRERTVNGMVTELDTPMPLRASLDIPFPAAKADEAARKLGILIDRYRRGI